LGQDNPKPYQGDSRDVEAELARRAAENAQTHVADIPVGAPSRQSRGEAVAAREVVFRPGMSGTSVAPCPACGKHVHDRVFPNADGSNGYALVHARCEAGGEQMMMEATPDQDVAE
jgi:hypothetical protein